MVEAQQARLGEFGEEGLVDIASDATRMQMRRMVERLIAGERSELAADKSTDSRTEMRIRMVAGVLS